jgi:hypothetical protein
MGKADHLFLCCDIRFFLPHGLKQQQKVESKYRRRKNIRRGKELSG